MAVVSVLVSTLNPGSALPGLAQSVDAQTMPATDFELVIVDASSDGSGDRLRQLAGRRPNVTVLTADAGGTRADRLGLALQRATGEFVVVISQQQRLAPRALELLLDRAQRTGAELVLGRAVTRTGSGSAVLPDDSDRLDIAGTGTELDLAKCFAMARRSLLDGRTDAGAALLDLPALAGQAATVSALGRYACTTEQGVAAPSEGVSLESTTSRWEAGMLHLAIGIRLSGSVPPPLHTWLVVTRGLAEVALPATVEPSAQGSTALAASAVLDPRTAEGGHPLEDGPWSLLFRLAWPDREVTLPLAPSPTRSAVVARPYVARAAGRDVLIDAGATRTSVIGPVPASRASIAESAHGALVTIDYADLHVHGDAVLDARLLLDRFILPGHLVCREGRAQLQAYASSLAGTSVVAVVAGGGTPVLTGLRLLVDGTGGMALEKAPAPPRTPPTAETPGDARLVQRLRRRLPGGLDPLAHRLADVPVLRQAYRRLISR